VQGRIVRHRYGLARHTRPAYAAQTSSYDFSLNMRSRIGDDTSNQLRREAGWVHSEYMVLQGTIGRFVRWGMIHGPAWGLLVAIPLAVFGDVGAGKVQIVLAGLLGGMIAGPLLGFAAGVACWCAELVPKWILDAPDYVAVATVAGIVGGVAWPVLELGRSGPVTGMVAVVVLTAVPAIDAARSAPRLLFPAASESLAAVDAAAGGQAS
jgi:hypothetical protein